MELELTGAPVAELAILPTKPHALIWLDARGNVVDDDLAPNWHVAQAEVYRGEWPDDAAFLCVIETDDRRARVYTRADAGKRGA